MKLNRKWGLLLAAAATVGAGAAAAAVTDTATTTAATTGSTATTAPAGRHWHHRHGSMLVGMMLHATRQLNLTTEQQASIKEILSTARSQHRQDAASLDLASLANPADPNYAANLQNAKALAASRIQRESELQGEIYNVLTTEQKAKLPQVLAAMKTKAEQRRAAWQQQHATGAAGTGAGSN